MKKHVIIPIFISHRGCPNDCVFCNQKKITARDGDVTPEDVSKTVETWLTTLHDLAPSEIELAFFGGSFTGLPLSEQEAFLEVAKGYKEAGRIGKIHLSTRPDYISPQILDNLKRYGVDVIELGVQSFDEEVLRLSGRGHHTDVVYQSAALIQDYGFTLGIQLMIGLPGDSLQKCVFSAEETVKIAPKIARLYPTVVLRDTALYEAYQAGSYTPLTEADAVERTKAMYEILDNAGIQIIRVGLKSSDIMAEETAFHPAFRQLVEGSIARDRLEAQLTELLASLPVTQASHMPLQDSAAEAGIKFQSADCSVVFAANQRSYNNLFGHRGCNRIYFASKYPALTIRYLCDSSLPDGTYRVFSPSDDNA